MKSTLLIALSAFAILTVSAQASTRIDIEIPYPSHHQLYYGTVKSVEQGLRAKIQARAIEVCGSKEKVGAIMDVEARFHFNMIMEDVQHFEGSYPLASASATIRCQ